MITKTIKRIAMRILPDIVKNDEYLAPTLDQVRKRYSPPLTFGAPKNDIIAMDNALSDAGMYSKLQEMFALGMQAAAAPQFLGYSFLSGIAQNGLIRAGVETLADEMANGWLKLTRSGDNSDIDPDNDRLAQLQREMDKYNLKQVFYTAAEYCGYFGGGLVYIDMGDLSDEDLKTPLTIDSATFRSGALRGFVPVEPINLYPGMYNTSNPLRSDYFVPRTWWVLGKEVHESRFLKFIINEPPMLLRPAYNFFGIATAQIAVDYVAHFTQDRESASRLLKKFSLTVFKTNMSSLMYGGVRDDFDRRMQIFAQNRDNDNIEAIDKEEEDIAQINTPIGGVTDIVRQALELLAVVFRIPAVKLLGISPAGFNATGESDLDNWHEHVLSQEEKIWKAPMSHALKILQMNAFSEVDGSIGFEFNELGRRDETAQANVNKIKADIDAIYLDRGILSGEEIRARLVTDPASGYNNIDADEMPETEELPDDNFGATDAKEFEESKIKRADNGQFGSGGSNKSESDSGNPIEIRGDELGEYNDIKELRQKASQYYKDNLQGKSVDNPELGKVEFTGQGLRKYVSTSANADKLKMVVAIKNIVQNGKKESEEKVNKPREDKMVKFYRIGKEVQLDGQLYKASVLIGEDRAGRKFYNLNPDAAEYKKPFGDTRATMSGHQRANDRNDIVSTDNIVSSAEEINIFLEEM